MSIQLDAVERVAQMLENIGANFEIRYEEKVFGGIRHERKKRLDYTVFDIKNQVSNMQLGDVLIFRTRIDRPEIDLEMLRGNAVSHCVMNFGKGSCISKLRDKESFEIMRIN